MFEVISNLIMELKKPVVIGEIPDEIDIEICDHPERPYNSPGMKMDYNRQVDYSKSSRVKKFIIPSQFRVQGITSYKI